jgi:D-threo-aldose 1-dehydrogenase
MGWMRPLGATGLQVSALCLGGGPLGSMPRLFGKETPEERGIATVLAALDSPIRFIDTSNGYSDGESERRIGAALRRIGGVPEGVVIETKTDPKDGDYSGDRVRRSVEESMERLGFDRLPMVHLHDPENWAFDAIAGAGGAVRALVDLREQGVVGSIGLAGGDVRIMAKYLALEVFDVLLVHNRWTLVDRSATGVIAEARRQGMGILNAAVYGGGILAHQQDEGSPTTYGYRPAPQPVLDAVTAMRAVCTRYGTDLSAAALQFSIRDDTFASTIVGMSRPERIAVTVAAAQAPLPDDLFAELETLLPAEEFWLDSPL